MELRADRFKTESGLQATVRRIKNHRLGCHRGNALFYILIAIALVGALTYSVSQQSSESTDFIDNASNDEQIARMMTYAGTLASALNQMVVAGNAKAETLYTDLKTDAPNTAAYGTAPYNMQLYHPQGGGMNYVTATGDTADSNTVATDFYVVKDASVKNIGPTDTGGDIMFVAKVTSAAACARINYLLTGDGTVTPMVAAAFNGLFVSHTSAVIDGTNCATCVGKSQYCVSNGTSWGYYATLFPG